MTLQLLTPCDDFGCACACACASQVATSCRTNSLTTLPNNLNCRSRALMASISPRNVSSDATMDAIAWIPEIHATRATFSNALTHPGQVLPDLTARSPPPAPEE